MSSEDDKNLYRPGDSEEQAQSVSKNNKTKTVSWTASEFIEHQRGASWYLGLVAATAAITAATYFITKEYFATGTILVVGIIVAVFVRHKPRQITYEVDERGLKAGDRTFNYGEFKSFSVFSDGALNSLNLYPLKRFMPPISAYFEAKDQDRIVSIVGEHLPLEERSPDKLENLSRRLKL